MKMNSFSANNMDDDESTSSESSYVAPLISEFVFLAASLDKLNQSIKFNVQCHHRAILDQLSQIIKLLSYGDVEYVEDQCNALLNAGMIGTIVKLLNCTNNKQIIDSCFELGEVVTFHATAWHYVTREYVSTIS